MHRKKANLGAAAFAAIAEITEATNNAKDYSRSTEKQCTHEGKLLESPCKNKANKKKRPSIEISIAEFLPSFASKILTYTERDSLRIQIPPFREGQTLFKKERMKK